MKMYEQISSLTDAEFKSRRRASLENFKEIKRNMKREDHVILKEEVKKYVNAISETILRWLQYSIIPLYQETCKVIDLNMLGWPITW